MIKDMKIFFNGQEMKFPFDLNKLFAQMPRDFCYPREPSEQRPMRPQRPMRMVRKLTSPGEQQVKTVWYNVDIRKDLETLNERVTRLEELLIKKELKKPVKTKPKTKVAKEKPKKEKAKKVNFI